MTEKKRTRGQNEGSIHQRADGLWVAVLNLGWVNGKRKRKYLYAHTRRDVAEKLTTALRDHQRGVPVSTDRQTVAQFLEHWLEQVARPSVRPRTYDSYALLVRRHIVPAIGRHRLDKLTAQHVQQLLNAKRAEGLSPRTVQYIRAVLRRALNQALKWDLVGRNVATLVNPPRSERHEIKPLSPAEAGRFLEAAHADRLEGLYSVALALGLRQGEAFGLRWRDVDFGAGTISVRYQLQRIDGKPQFVDLKTDRSRRTIPIPEPIIGALRRHRQRQLEERLLAGGRWQGDSWGLVFCSTIGTPLNPSNVTRKFHELLQAAELPRIRFHDLRHTCASFMLAQGVHPRVVMEVLGHSQISLTLDTYSHVMPSTMREATELMGGLFEGDKWSS